MAFVRCRPKLVKEDDSKLILWENFNPQGQPFSKTVDVNEYDLRNNCTFFCDVEVSNSTEETLISVGREIDTRDGNTYPRSILHFSYPYNGRLKIYLSARYSGGTARRVTKDIAVSGNRLKIAFNSNGIVVNGEDVGTLTYFNEYIPRLYGDTTRPIEIGSIYGNHSNEKYNEVGFRKVFLSIAEMQTLTR